MSEAITLTRDVFGSVMEPVLAFAVGGYIVLLAVDVLTGFWKRGAR